MQINIIIGFITLLSINLYAADFNPGQLYPSESVSPLPQFLPEQERNFQLPTPKLPESYPGNSQQGVRFKLNSIIFEGNQVVSTQQLQTLVKPYLSELVTLADIEAIRLAVTNLYITQGYINSGAIIPKQKARHGNIRIKIIEGRLNKLSISGNDDLRVEYIRERLWPENTQVFQTEVLRERFQLLLADPLIERLNGALKPGFKLGESELDLQISRSQKSHLSVSLDNYRTPSSGSEQLKLQGDWLNPSGYGDKLQGSLAKTQGAYDIGADYFFPLNAQNTRLGVEFSLNHSKVIEAPLQQSGISSDYQSWGFYLSHPIVETLNQSIRLQIGLTHKHSQTFLLNNGTPFSIGSDERGVANTATLYFLQEYTQRSQQQVIALRSKLNWGLDILAASNNDNNINGRFFNWLGQAQLAYRPALNSSAQWLIRSTIQLTNGPLLSMERFSLGGIDTVRGYRQNTFVTDNGALFSLAYEFPLLKTINIESEHQLRLQPFVDLGWSWNDQAWTEHHRLVSAGLGLYWKWQDYAASLIWAKAFQRPNSPYEHNIQDNGIHFQLLKEIY